MGAGQRSDTMMIFKEESEEQEWKKKEYSGKRGIWLLRYLSYAEEKGLFILLWKCVSYLNSNTQQRVDYANWPHAFCSPNGCSQNWETGGEHNARKNSQLALVLWMSMGQMKNALALFYLSSREIQLIMVCIFLFIYKNQLADIVWAQHPTRSCHPHLLFSPGQWHSVIVLTLNHCHLPGLSF